MTGSKSGTPRFENVTEAAGIPVTAEAADMIYTRYRVGAHLASGKRVLELGCGAGNGLGLLARRAAQLVGADYSEVLLGLARRHFGDRVPLARLTAEALPFRAGVFDLVLFFEASYYVPHMDLAFGEIARVLAPGGEALFVNANPERPDFITSPYSVHYHTADEFRRSLDLVGLTARGEGAFPVGHEAIAASGRLLAFGLAPARRVLESLRLVPKTLRGRARLKRLIFGRLKPLPPEIPEGFARVVPRTPLAPGPARGFKVIYVLGRKAAAGG